MASLKQAIHALKDPSELTPLEQRIHELRNSGLSHSQIAKQLGGKWTGKNVGTKLTLIKEKLECR